jgi:UDPglucose--hexose-1-phosphate uridylyltransferase
MELRKDYILDRWVLIAARRAKRPHQYHPVSKIDPDQICFFCPGNEHLTPPEIGRIINEADHDKWDMRWFPNKFAAVDYLNPSGVVEPRTDNDYFTFSSAYGSHEVIVETPDHEAQMHDYSVSRIKKLLHVYADRITALENEQHVKYVNVFKNEGEDAATSLIHSHSQAVSLNVVPALVRKKAAANEDHCHYCDIWKIERESDRNCFENDHAVAFTPYASRFNYELWFFPKRHVRRIDELSDDELFALADLMKKAFVKLADVSSSYNMAVYYAPEGSDLHLHIELLPRIAKFGGFEFLTDMIINSVSPEFAASVYRGEN